MQTNDMSWGYRHYDRDQHPGFTAPDRAWFKEEEEEIKWLSEPVKIRHSESRFGTPEKEVMACRASRSAKLANGMDKIQLGWVTETGRWFPDNVYDDDYVVVEEAE